MSVRLYINDFQVDLYEGQKIGYTKQVNSLTDLASRQTNFSENFKVPDTSKNIENFKGLGIIGSTSNVPYQQNKARLFVGNICLVVKGLVIYRGKDGKDFEINTYDGNIDFFKQLDNVKFDEIPIPELDHEKTVAKIKSNWTSGNDYFKYLLANYNGKVNIDIGGQIYVNTDYLVPSVKTEFLWERIFSNFNFGFSGTTFNTEKFKNLFLTYPKGIKAGEDGELAFKLSFPSQEVGHIGTFDFFLPLFVPIDFEDIETEVNSGSIHDNSQNPIIKSWECGESGYYRVKITGSISSKHLGESSSFYWGRNIDVGYKDIQESQLEQPPVICQSGETESIDISKPIYLNQGETVSAFYTREYGFPIQDQTMLNFEFEVYKIEQTQIDQFDFFKGLTPKDFYKEIMWRFGLTPFPVKDKEHIDFLTYEERINGEIEDWSAYYNGSPEEDSEEYIFGEYEKRNYFRFKYNGEGDEFNDGYFSIDNENLEESKDVIKSKTYSPNKLFKPLNLGTSVQNVPVVELWQRELKQEDGEPQIEYKARESRFTFLRELQENKTARIASEQLGESDTAYRIAFAESADYSWQTIIDSVYKPIKNLFNKTLVVKTVFRFTPQQFDAFDLRPRVYVKQLGGEFLVNKMSKNDLTEDETKAELIKINR